MHLEFSERFIAMDERFRSMELRIEQFEGRVMDRLDRVETEVQAVRAALGRTDQRVAALEKQVLGLNTRLDTMADDMRQRFRVLNERVSELAA
jgi:septal ring factor EnvC (AmiA/AmiB activator)